MGNLYGYDATDIPPADDFEPLPDGLFPVVIIESEMRPTHAGDGRYLYLVEEVIDGPYTGRRLWDRLNLENQNEQTVKIAQRTLSAICHAVGILKPTDSSELHGKPMLAKVVVKPAKGQWPVGNEIKGYKPIDGEAAPTPPPKATVPAAAPWKHPAATPPKQATLKADPPKWDRSKKPADDTEPPY